MSCKPSEPTHQHSDWRLQVSSSKTDSPASSPCTTLPCTTPRLVKMIRVSPGASPTGYPRTESSGSEQETRSPARHIPPRRRPRLPAAETTCPLQQRHHLSHLCYPLRGDGPMCERDLLLGQRRVMATEEAHCRSSGSSAFHCEQQPGTWYTTRRCRGVKIRLL
jgi:hypothetical protein